jgi:hypothetical protein
MKDLRGREFDLGAVEDRIIERFAEVFEMIPGSDKFNGPEPRATKSDFQVPSITESRC